MKSLLALEPNPALRGLPFSSLLFRQCALPIVFLPCLIDTAVYRDRPLELHVPARGHRAHRSPFRDSLPLTSIAEQPARTPCDHRPNLSRSANGFVPRASCGAPDHGAAEDALQERQRLPRGRIAASVAVELVECQPL